MTRFSDRKKQSKSFSIYINFYSSAHAFTKCKCAFSIRPPSHPLIFSSIEYESGHVDTDGHNLNCHHGVGRGLGSSSLCLGRSQERPYSVNANMPFRYRRGFPKGSRDDLPFIKVKMIFLILKLQIWKLVDNINFGKLQSKNYYES